MRRAHSDRSSGCSTRRSRSTTCSAKVELLIEGADGYRLSGNSSMREISRDPAALVSQALSEHQYPDGFALFLGTLFAPVQDRDEPGRGFTHKTGDVVRISSPRLGTLVNRVTTSKAAAPWTLGIGALMSNLAGRGLLHRRRNDRWRRGEPRSLHRRRGAGRRDTAVEHQPVRHA